MIRLAALLAGVLCLGTPAAAHVYDHLYGNGFDTPADAPGSDAEAARFLTQATFGPTPAEIARLRALGYREWLAQQLGMPATAARPVVEQVIAARTAGGQGIGQSQRLNRWFWTATYAPDQLRQRMAWALSQIFVVSDQSSSISQDYIPLAEYGDLLALLNGICFGIFVVELVLRIASYGRDIGAFFRNGWNVFDFVVVAIALVPASGPLAVFRALRVLRVLRLVSAIPKMRFVIESLLRSLPGLGSIAMLLVVLFYVFAVVATKLFGAAVPQWFGTLWGSAFSLFQVMTLEGWAEIAREVMQVHPLAWIFFIAFILVATFTVLNFFIALIVKAMEEPVTAGATGAAASTAGACMAGFASSDAATALELAALRAEIGALRRELQRTG